MPPRTPSTVMLVEGPADVVAVARLRHTLPDALYPDPYYAVAPCGTALTAEQVALLAAAVPQGTPIVAAFDADDAGQAAIGHRSRNLRPPAPAAGRRRPRSPPEAAPGPARRPAGRACADRPRPVVRVAADPPQRRPRDSAVHRRGRPGQSHTAWVLSEGTGTDPADRDAAHLAAEVAGRAAILVGARKAVEIAQVAVNTAFAEPGTRQGNASIVVLCSFDGDRPRHGMEQFTVAWAGDARAYATASPPHAPVLTDAAKIRSWFAAVTVDHTRRRSAVGNRFELCPGTPDRWPEPTRRRPVAHSIGPRRRDRR